MGHLLTQIRDNVVSDVTGLTTTGARVFSGRVHALESGVLPCLAVDVGDETGDYASIGYPRVIAANAVLDITAIASTTGDFDAIINQMQLEIQLGISADPTLGGIASNVVFTGRKRMVTGGREPVAALIISYDVLYRYAENNPEVTA